MSIYVASSWRNAWYPGVVVFLREAGHDVYDFRNEGFRWSVIDPDWRTWSVEAYRQAMEDAIAVSGYRRDMAALDQSDACVLVLPSGRSAHLEAGYAAASGKLVVAYVPYPIEAELMYRMFSGGIASTLDEVAQALSVLRAMRSCARCDADYMGWPGGNGLCPFCETEIEEDGRDSSGR